MFFLNFQKIGDLLPSIIKDSKTNQVLMLGYMNQEALQRTLQEKKVWFFSRKKKRLWMKGEKSGNELWVKAVYSDCDQDAILIEVEPKGPTCHTGKTSCFFTVLLKEEASL